jgi:hypothetical protein
MRSSTFLESGPALPKRNGFADTKRNAIEMAFSFEFGLEELALSERFCEEDV